LTTSFFEEFVQQVLSLFPRFDENNNGRLKKEKSPKSVSRMTAVL